MSSLQISVVFLMITLVSFLGFCVENIWLAMTKGYIDNRNMHFPFLIGYGLAMVTIFLLFGTPQELRLLSLHVPIENRILQTVAYFMIVFFCVSVGEILLGTLVEKTCGIVWWNYSKLPLHITKYTSIPTSLAFASMITVFMGCFFTPLFHRFMRLNPSKLHLLAGLFMVLMITDYLHNTYLMYKNRALTQRWRIDLENNRLHRYWISKHPVS